MKFLNLHDTHIKGKNSAYRIGNYAEDCFTKLQETIDLSVKNKCDCVIHSGDLYDSPLVAYSLIDNVTDMIEKAGIPWYLVAGNHDEIGQNWENSSKSSLAHLIRRSSIIHKMEELSGEGYYIKGYDYTYNIDNDIKSELLKHDKTGVFSIAIPHAFITEKPFLPMVNHVEAKNIATNYDLVLCSHFHCVFDFEVNGTRYVNNGAWGRLSIREAEHRPKVSIIDTEKKGVEVIDLKSARPGSEIFDLTRKETANKFSDNINQFIESVKDIKTQGMSLVDILRICAKKNETPETILTCIYDRIGEIEKEEFQK